MTLVVDASMVVAALTNGDEDGRWAEELLAGESLAAPHLMPVEAARSRKKSSPGTKFAGPRDIGCGPRPLIDARRLRHDSVAGAEPDSWLERAAGVFVPPASAAVPGMH